MEVTDYRTLEIYNENTLYEGRGYYSSNGASYKISQKLEEWSYNCGRNRFIHILIFRGGILETVKVAGYGSGDSDCIGLEQRQQRQKHREEEKLESYTETGRIHISGSPNGAEVYLDEYYAGAIPCTLEQVKEGPHNVMVKYEGYKAWKIRVIVTADETLSLMVNLEME